VIDFKTLKIDALLVSSLPNVRYLTGYTGSNGMAVLTPDSLTLFTDPRYKIRAREDLKQAKMPARVRIGAKPLWEAAAAYIKRKHLKRTGFEQAQVSYSVYQAMNEDLPLGYSLRPIGPAIEELRMVKNADEIERIRRSVLTNSKTFDAVAKRIRPCPKPASPRISTTACASWAPKGPLSPPSWPADRTPRMSTPAQPGRLSNPMNYY
jgi:Xaa-Pro aminopeptidase